MSATVFVIIIFAVCVTSARAQTMNADLNKGELELGFTAKVFHRNLKPGSRGGVDWGIPSFFVKYGLNDRLSFIFEGIIRNLSKSRFPNRNYRLYSIGIGGAIEIASLKHVSLVFEVLYAENFYFDRSEEAHHKQPWSVLVSGRLKNKTSILNQQVSSWAAPVYAYDGYSDYPTPETSLRSTSSNNIGLAAGVDLLLFEHVRLFYHLVYAEYRQPRFGIGYLF